MFNNLAIRAAASIQSRTAHSIERGGETIEFGVVILVAVAFALVVFNLVTSGKFNGIISNLLDGVLDKASKMAK